MAEIDLRQFAATKIDDHQPPPWASSSTSLIADDADHAIDTAPPVAAQASAIGIPTGSDDAPRVHAFPSFLAVANTSCHAPA